MKEPQYIDKDIPYSVRTKIIGFAQQSKKPREFIQLSKKQLKGKQEYLAPMVQRIYNQNAKKDAMIDQLNIQGLNLSLYKKAKKKYHEFLDSDAHLQQQLMMPLKRSPNYYKYVHYDFLDYLRLHPYSKRIHISNWHQDALIFFRDGNNTVVVHFPIPDDFEFATYDGVKRYILENDIPVTDYQILDTH